MNINLYNLLLNSDCYSLKEHIIYKQFELTHQEDESSIVSTICNENNRIYYLLNLVLGSVLLTLLLVSHEILC